MGVKSDASQARAAALEIVQALRDLGHVAYFAGGCVRDELLGLEPSDYDVATDATPPAITDLFSRTAHVGASFGVVLVNDFGPVVEVATFRADGRYSDNRRPDSIEFSDAKTDATRRDFTVNALFLDPADDSGEPGSPLGGRVIDHVGGLEDLQARVIRAVGDADARLAEDHLRALRAVRLAARLSFAIDPATSTSITSHAGDLRGVSRERVGDEIRRMLSHPTRREAVRLLCSLGLNAPVLQEPSEASTTPTLDEMGPDAPYPEVLSAWAIDRGALASADTGRSMVRRWRKSLCLTNDERDILWNVLSGIQLMEGDWVKLGVAAQKRSAAAQWFGSALNALEPRDPGLAQSIRNRVRDLEATPGGIAPEPLVTGDDLIVEGFTPGPQFKVLLDTAYDAQLEGRVASRGEALELIRGLGV